MSDKKGEGVVGDRQDSKPSGGNSVLRSDGTVHHTNWDEKGRTSWDEKNGNISKVHETEKTGNPKNVDTDNRGQRK